MRVHLVARRKTRGMDGEKDSTSDNRAECQDPIFTVNRHDRLKIAGLRQYKTPQLLEGGTWGEKRGFLIHKLSSAVTICSKPSS